VHRINYIKGQKGVQMKKIIWHDGLTSGKTVQIMSRNTDMEMLLNCGKSQLFIKKAKFNEEDTDVVQSCQMMQNISSIFGRHVEIYGFFSGTTVILTNISDESKENYAKLSPHEAGKLFTQMFTLCNSCRACKTIPLLHPGRV
jgi:hypothetical protein